MERRKHLSECIDFDRDIFTLTFNENDENLHKIALITAGVGAGKNTWIRETLMGNQTILLITSRRSVVNAELLKAEEISKGLQSYGMVHSVKRTCSIFDPSEYLSKQFWANVDFYTDIITTNSYIAWFLENVYDANDPKTHVWEKYDLIIIDEAHSLEMDSTFSDAPFHLMEMIKDACMKTIKQIGPTIILMTGTPEPIEWIAEGPLGRYFHKIDLMDECIDVSPKECIFVEYKYALAKMDEEYKKGNRIVYFANRIRGIQKMIDDLHKIEIPDAEIAVAFSQDDREEDFSPEIIQNKNETEQMLKDKDRLPEKIRAFISTSKYKEGVSIMNDHIDAVFVESHSQSDIKQMAGRIRKGAKRIYVIVDSLGFDHQGSTEELLLCQSCLEGINDAYCDYCNNYLEKDPKKFIKMVHDKFRYVRFNYFTENFQLYERRIERERIQREESQMVKDYYAQWYSRKQTADDVNLSDSPVSTWFPYCSCESFEDVHKKVHEYLKKNQLINKPFSNVQKDKITADINAIIDQYPSRKYSRKGQFAALLRQFGLSHMRTDQNGKSNHKLKAQDGFTVIYPMLTYED